jgi:hypothetical protein
MAAPLPAPRSLLTTNNTSVGITKIRITSQISKNPSASERPARENKLNQTYKLLLLIMIVLPY